MRTDLNAAADYIDPQRVTDLERRADATHGPERGDVLARLAEVYEDHLGDLPEATRRFEPLNNPFVNEDDGGDV